MPSLGVIVGRFQVPEIHKAHKALIQYASMTFDQVLVIIGVAPVSSKANPLPEYYVKDIVSKGVDFCNNVLVDSMLDKPTNEEWSIALDEKITKIFPFHDPVLLGGRDSFIPRYTGINKTRELGPQWFGLAASVSGTQIREGLCPKDYEDKEAFYAGYIAAIQDRRDITYNTVDILVTRGDNKEVLLGRKKVDDGLRLPGGFVDAGELPTDAAARELKEETGIVASPVYVTDKIVPDWRFRSSTDRILTRLYKVEVTDQEAVAGDDLVKLEWRKINELCLEDLADSHKIFFMHIKGWV